MKQFLKLDSIEEGMKRIRIDIETVDVYCEYDSTGLDEEEPLKCIVIKLTNGTTHYVDSTIEYIDEIYDKYNIATRMGYSGDNAYE